MSSVRWCAALPVLLLLLPRPGAATAQVWGVDGVVSAIAQQGQTVYVGGSFSNVGPCTGGGVWGSTHRWQIAEEFPQIAGTVRASIPDGHGGWYIGGQFAGLAGLPYANLAHVLADGSVAAWAPNPNAPVLGLLLSDKTLFVWGGFTRIGGQVRLYVAALDAPTGIALPWDAHVNAVVNCAVLTSVGLIVGGKFTSIAGQPHPNLGALDPTTGAAQPWGPSPNDLVSALAEVGNTLYVGGEFTRLGGNERHHLAAVDLRTNTLLEWSPAPEVADLGPTPPPAVTALAVQGSTVYVAGGFVSIGGQSRLGLAAVDRRTGVVDAWDPQGSEPPYPYPVYFALDVRGDVVYVGGTFTHVGGADRSYVAALDRKSGLATPWDPRPNALTYVVTTIDDEVFIGGAFWSIGDTWVARSSLAAFDAVSGVVLPWDPHSDAAYIRALCYANGVVYAGGDFSHVGDEPRDNIAALDPLTGVATPWNPGADGAVWTIAADAGRVYLGGLFSSLGGVARAYAGAADARTGLPLPWNPGANDAVSVIAPSGERVYAGGFFRRIGGRLLNGLAALDTLDGQSQAWNPGLDGVVAALAVQGQTVWAGGYFTSVGGSNHPNLCALDAQSAAPLPWPANPNGGVTTLALKDSTLYAGGFFEAIGDTQREFLAAFHTGSGALTEWSPGANGNVWSLCPVFGTMYVGGEFNTVGYRQAVNLAAVPLGSTKPRVQQIAVAAIEPTAQLEAVRPNPMQSAGVIQFRLTHSAQVRVGVFDMQGRRVALPVGSAFMSSGEHQVELATREWTPGCYLYQLDVDGHSVSGKFSVVR